MFTTHPLSESLAPASQVLSLFLIPIGGGIPAGVLLARNLSLSWPFTALLYLISDVILACVFEPLMWLFVSGAKRSKRLRGVGDALRASTRRTMMRYGHSTGPFTLILIAFGVDPMTGRAAAAAAGHKFVMGWVFAIAGDMIYFAVLMASTLWLDGILGDGTWTTLTILALMIAVPWAVRRIRELRDSRRMRRI